MAAEQLGRNLGRERPPRERKGAVEGEFKTCINCGTALADRVEEEERTGIGGKPLHRRVQHLPGVVLSQQRLRHVQDRPVSRDDSRPHRPGGSVSVSLDSEKGW